MFRALNETLCLWRCRMTSNSARVEEVKKEVTIDVSDGPNLQEIIWTVGAPQRTLLQEDHLSTFTFYLPNDEDKEKVAKQVIFNVIIVGFHRISSDSCEMKGYIPIFELNRNINPRMYPYLVFKGYTFLNRKGSVTMPEDVFRQLECITMSKK